MPRDDRFDEEERPTGTLCLACAGSGKALVEDNPGHWTPTKCAWCGGTGAMSPEQLSAWKNRLRIR